MRINIPYGRQTIDKKDIEAVVKVLSSDFLTQGPTIEKFEKKLTEYCGVKYAVVFSSGTAALHAACFAANISSGDEVITSPMTFAATANCILYCGGTPIFADIKKDIPLIDPAEIKKKITSKTKAIIPVDYSGIPADYAEINTMAKKNNLIVIADSAHSLGATYKNKKVGTLADMTVFSFHPVKSITTGEGGMVVTDNYKFYKQLKMFRTHGITKDKKFLINKHIGPWYYEMQELGFNYRLTDMQAVLGLSQLKKLNTFVKKRKEIAATYRKTFVENVFFDMVEVPKNRTSAWHLFPILLKNKSKRKKMVAQYHKVGIGVQVHYIPIHLHPYYKNKFGYKEGDFINSEDFYHREISLPLFPELTKSEINKVINQTQKILDSFL